MKLLLDTHLLIWAAEDIREVPKAARKPMADPDNELFFSPASIWEIAIKFGLGKPDFQIDPRLLYRGLLDNGYEELSITTNHTIAVVSLPAIHKDPFDRLLIAQATVEGILLLTSDPTVAQYPGPIRKV